MNLSRISRLLCLLIGFTLLPDRCGAQSSAPEIRANYFRNNMSGAYVVNSGNWQNFRIYWYGQFYSGSPYGFSQSSVWNRGQTNPATYINAYTDPAPNGWTSVYVTNTATASPPGNYWEHRIQSFTHVGILTYAYDRDTQIELVAGGDATAPVSPSIFKLTAGVTAYTTDPNTGQLLYSTALAPGAFQIAGQTPDADGNVWVTANDQATLDVTPVIIPPPPNGNVGISFLPPPFYSFTVTGAAATKTKLKINMADAPLDPNNPWGPLRGTTNIAGGGSVTVVVGQQISLSFPDITLAGTFSNISWTLPSQPDKVVKGFIPNAPNGNANYGGPVLFDTNDFTLPGIVFYFVAGGSQQVACSAQLNGVTHSLTASFNVIRPTVDWMGVAQGGVAIDNNHISYDGGVHPSIHIGYRIDSVIFDYEGMTFYRTNYNSQGYTGGKKFEVIQISQSVLKANYYHSGNNVHRTYTGYGLDTGGDSYQYNNYDDITGTGGDSPWERAYNWYDKFSITDSFVTYLLFKPSLPGSIPIPLKKIEWNWFGVGYLGSLISTGGGPNITANNAPTLSFSQPTWISKVLPGVKIDDIPGWIDIP